MSRVIPHPSYVPVRGLGCGCALKGTEPSPPLSGKIFAVAAGIATGALVFYAGKNLYPGEAGVRAGCMGLGILATYYAMNSGFYETLCVQQQVKPPELVNT